VLDHTTPEPVRAPEPSAPGAGSEHTLPTTPVRAARRSRLARVAAQGLVLVMVTGATSAFALMHKTVDVDVDGTTTQVTGFGRTVSDVLADAGIDAGAGDLVAPALDAPVHNGGEVVVRHGHDVTLEVDGETKTVWTTALTVGEALGDLGVRGDGARASASRSAPLGRGDVLRVSTQKTVHLAVDGQVVDGVTTASTVREALQELGLVLAEGDQVSVPLDATAVDGLVVLVTRAAQTTTTTQETLPFTETVVEDPTLTQGKRQIETRGQEGRRQVTYTAATVGGAEVGRSVVAEVVLADPVTQVVRVGTKPPEPEPAEPATPDASDAPAPVIDVDPGSAQAIARDMLAARGWGGDQFSCLVQLWNHESGWRVNAANRSSGAYGIPQALPGSKMASVADDWRTNPATQITWGLGYISGRYGTPCGAWSSFQAKGWY
jgi:uncharacterized protein YabE (DUF348 family)